MSLNDVSSCSLERGLEEGGNESQESKEPGVVGRPDDSGDGSRDGEKQAWMHIEEISSSVLGE